MGTALPIDRDKLSKELAIRNLTNQQAAKEIDRSDTFFNTILRRGCTSPGSIRLLEEKLHIEYSKIRPGAAEEPKPVEIPGQIDLQSYVGMTMTEAVVQVGRELVEAVNRLAIAMEGQKA